MHHSSFTSIQSFKLNHMHHFTSIQSFKNILSIEQNNPFKHKKFLVKDRFVEELTNQSFAKNLLQSHQKRAPTLKYLSELIKKDFHI